MRVNLLADIRIDGVDGDRQRSDARLIDLLNAIGQQQAVSGHTAGQLGKLHFGAHKGLDRRVVRQRITRACHTKHPDARFLRNRLADRRQRFVRFDHPHRYAGAILVGAGEFAHTIVALNIATRRDRHMDAPEAEVRRAAITGMVGHVYLRNARAPALVRRLRVHYAPLSHFRC